MNTRLNFRLLFAIAALASLGMLGGAYFMEYHFQLEPCSLCLLQRYVLWCIVFLLLVGILSNPRDIGRILYNIGLMFFSLLGISLATRHLWLQHLPPSTSMPTCTAGLEKMLAFKPFFEVLKTILTETQDACNRVDFTIFGFSLSFWSLLYFIGLVIFCLILISLQIKRRI